MSAEGLTVDEAASWAGAYVHVPFCARVCPYCDFAVVAGRDDVTGRYFAALEAEIAAEPAWRPLDAVFVGGGTPSHVPAHHLAGVLARLDQRFGLAPGAEVTLEANPEDWSPERSSALREAGFDRVSFGVQSFDADVLAYLGRRHTPEQAEAAVRVAGATGFRSVAVDLIMGSPGESLDSWKHTVDTAIDLGVDHVSTYTLTVERGTPLGRAVAGGAAAPDPDHQADEYDYAATALAAAGLDRYEVSNHARRGYECRYNLIVWAQGEYLAFGMGAHGHREGTRTWRVRRLDAYLDRVERGGSGVQDSETLDGVARERERLFVGLRRAAGVVAGDFGEEWLASPEAVRMLDAGVVARHGARIVVQRPLLTDAVARSVVGFGAE